VVKQNMIDMVSDTVTLPTNEMREAMFNAALFLNTETTEIAKYADSVMFFLFIQRIMCTYRFNISRKKRVYF